MIKATPIPARRNISQRKCACGGTLGLGGECEACRSKRLQRKSTNAEVTLRTDSAVPTIVHEVVRSSGQPLDARTRGFMETRFSHDFSRVQIHTDARAVKSARTVNALAYTVGCDIVFDAGQYAPRTSEGQKLLAHELTHVVQQTHASSSAQAATALIGSDDSSEREAAVSADAVLHDAPARVGAPIAFGALQRQKNPLDDKAKAIIGKAKDTTVDADKRAVQLVNDIITEYYAGDAAKVDRVVFDDAKAGSGLDTVSVGSGPTTKGKISVGNYFVNNVDSFARRVLQVGHELEHIDQYRGGLAGGQNKNKREFLAFHDESLAVEKTGTGRLSFATRLALIDAALGYYYCLSDEEQKSLDSKKQALLKRRAEVNGKGGNDPTDPPTKCKTQ
jgi:hypothetical protein